MADVATLAYAAGLFDGEGSVLIIRGVRQDEVRVVVAMRDATAIRFMEETFGGRAYYRRRHPSMSASWASKNRWQASTRAAEAFLRSVMPYLKVKHAQAEVALAFVETMGRRSQPVSAERQARRTELHQRLRSLNRRGALAEHLRAEVE